MKIKNKTLIKVNKTQIGETIEQKVERIINNGEPIEDGAPIIYTDRRDGAQPDYDVRADRFDIAIDAMDKVTKSKLTKRADFYKKSEEKSPESESTPAT